MSATFLQPRDLDLLWGIYQFRPLTTSEVARAFFNGNVHNAARKCKVLRERGFMTARGSHLPPPPGTWRAGGRTELRHEVTLQGIQEVCATRGVDAPSRWRYRWDKA